MVGPLLQKNPAYVFDEIVEVVEKMRNSSVDDEEFIQKLKDNEITKQYSQEEIVKRIVSKYCKIQEVWNELLPKLKGNYKLGIINNGTAITIPSFKKINDFDEFFTTFINSSEISIEKPNKEIYLMTLEKMDLKPEETIFIDDTEQNVYGANNVGMKGLLFTSYTNLLKDLNSLGINI